MKIDYITLNKKDITDFAKARNELMQKSKSDWIFFIDSDETITNFQVPSINEFSNYQLTRKNYFLGQYVGDDKIVRLVKKGTGKWVRAVHEVWLPNNKNQTGIINNKYIIHNTADNLRDYIEKINFYSDLHAKANYQEGKKSSLFKIIFFPIGKFIMTLINSGHVVFSIMQSLHSFLSWTKLYLYY